MGGVSAVKKRGDRLIRPLSAVKTRGDRLIRLLSAVKKRSDRLIRLLHSMSSVMPSLIRRIMPKTIDIRAFRGAICRALQLTREVPCVFFPQNARNFRPGHGLNYHIRRTKA